MAVSAEWPPELLWAMSISYMGREEEERCAERIFRAHRRDAVKEGRQMVAVAAAEGSIA